VHLGFNGDAGAWLPPDAYGLAPVPVASTRQRRHPALRQFEAARSTMTVKDFIVRFFTWWNGATLNTLVWSSRHGELVGEDEYGNRYYRTRGGRIDPALGFERRWVIYRGLAEASVIGPAWHGWMHHTTDTPPTVEKVTPRLWWKPHRPNLTGTPSAYRPIGSTQAQNRRPKATGDYRPWRPER
jgi:NADH:ubiquinone oxidoreductase subunit